MSSLRMTRPWLAAAAALAFMTLGGCPRDNFDLGIHDPQGQDGDADGGTADGGNANPDTTACGSRGLPKCDDGEFCSFPEEAACGDTDKPGVCQPKPDACTEQYDPVCGCDGQTHGNACSAASAGVSIRHDGECESDPGSGEKVCGGFSGKQCDDGEYCKYPEGALCGIADATGVCEKRPDVCTLQYDPVCGCDGNTYGNECEAAGKGVGVMSPGACEDQPRLCGDVISADCPDGTYCKLEEAAQCGETETGTCEPRPEVCTEEYRPVCGCDGDTYDNACAAARSGVSVASEGECGQGAVCGVRGAKECADDEYCHFAEEAQCAAADVPGHCMKRPERCTRELAPVCGCDGNTYDNACTAATAGASVAHQGECENQTNACGGLQGLSCADGQFCNYTPEAQCGAADQLGECTEIPTICTREFNPVCGCDDNTYSNPCEARAAGVSVVSQGACGETGEPGACGGLQGLLCDDGQFCNFPIEAICGAADGLGVCTAIADACTREYRPVCGCDGVTYGNACTAAAAAISIASEGECPERLCGGIAGAQCNADEFCDYASDAQCGAADQTGVCTIRPEVCTADVQEVCGCNDRTYSNACAAHADGVSVLHDGPC